jgi:hypothetical protein
MNRKFIISTAILFLLILLTYFLAAYPVLLSILILLIAYIKHKLYPIKKELLWFMLVVVGGGITEVLLVNTGSVWTYSISQFMNIPIWIPLFWGAIATTIIVAYDGLIKRN